MKWKPELLTAQLETHYSQKGKNTSSGWEVNFRKMTVTPLVYPDSSAPYTRDPYTQGVWKRHEEQENIFKRRRRAQIALDQEISKINSTLCECRLQLQLFSGVSTEDSKLKDYLNEIQKETKRLEAELAKLTDRKAAFS